MGTGDLGKEGSLCNVTESEDPEGRWRQKGCKEQEGPERPCRVSLGTSRFCVTYRGQSCGTDQNSRPKTVTGREGHIQGRKLLTYASVG